MMLLAALLSFALADMQGFSHEELTWLGTGVVVICVCLSIAVMVKVLRDKGKISATVEGQPITIRKEIEFVPVPRFREFEQYVHDRNHALDNELNAIKLNAELQRKESADLSNELLEKIQEKLEAHWKELNKDRSMSTAALHQRLEATNNQLRQETDAKMQTVRHEINEMPSKIITLLRETGAIGHNKGARS